MDFCKANGIILSFPPHVTNRLQPLDVSVFGPFKKFYNQAACDWMKSHPRGTISMYDVPGIVKAALPNAATPKNIQAGFRACEIWEFDRNVFTDREFDPPAEILDSEIEQQAETENQMIRTEEDPFNATPVRNSDASTSGIQTTPDDHRPLSKTGKRKMKKNNRKVRKSAVLTDTPVKEALREEQLQKEKRTQGKGKKKLFASKPVDVKKMRKNLESNDGNSSDDDDDDCVCLVCLQSYRNSKRGEEWIQCKKNVKIRRM